ncbi:MAG: hypothetical protein EPO68_16725 [Planctomycetota bacterium]|nr:MAG: hypothetical protein EPO68_16725 [Planctomycetota bacterium]
MTLRACSAAAIALALLASACRDRTPAAPPKPAAAAAPAYHDSCAARIDALAKELGCPAPRVPAREDPESSVPVLVVGGQLRDEWVGLATPAAPDAALLELQDGLVASLASVGKLRTLALADLAALEEPAWAWLELRIWRGELEPAALDALIGALAERAGPWRSAALLAIAERCLEPVVRARAAHALAQDARDEWIVPRLALRLKYEVDHETAIELARALAARDNYGGIAALDVIAAAPARPELGARALEALAECARRAGRADAAGLHAAWTNGALRVERALEPRLELELLRRIAMLAAWQLRYVDDARHVLASMDGRAAAPLAAALADPNRYVRVHAAQCLERMKGRASGALDALLLALDDPTVASAAAAALGSIDDARARAELERRAQSASSPELRAAARRALRP